MKTPQLKMAPWARKEQRQKRRAERQSEFFFKVRTVFILLFVVTCLVYAHNHKVELQRIASEKLNQLANKPTLSDTMRERALKHENEVNQAGQPQTVPTPTTQTPRTP